MSQEHIAAVQRERELVLEKQAELRSKIEQYDTVLEHLDRVLEQLKSIDNRLAKAETNVKFHSNNDFTISSTGPARSLRQSILDYAASHIRFTSHGLIEELKKRNPDLNVASVRAELSSSVKRGILERETDGTYSMSFKSV